MSLTLPHGTPILGRGWSRLGIGLTHALLLSSLVGKSHLLVLEFNIWRAQMMAVVSLVGVGTVYSISRHSHYLPCAWGLPSWIKACLALLLCWGVAACAAQDNYGGNLAFLLVHAGLIYVFWGISVESMSGISPMRCLDLVLVPLCIMAGISAAFLVFGPSRLSFENRFHGLYRNAIIAGQMFGLTSVLLFWRTLQSSSRSWIGWVLLLLTLACVFVTRTRTDILGTVFGMLVCLVFITRGDPSRLLRHRRRILLVVGFLLTIFAGVWAIHGGMGIGPIRDYFRMSGDRDDILRSRFEYWQTGVGKLSLGNVFGDGPLAKYGGQLSTQRSGYVIDSNMHNAFLSMSQCYGWPGLLLFVIFIASLAGVFVRRRDPYASLGLSVLAFGALNCLSENWLLTFANPVDVYSWFLLGLALRERPRSIDEWPAGLAGPCAGVRQACVGDGVSRF